MVEMEQIDSTIISDVKQAVKDEQIKTQIPKTILVYGAGMVWDCYLPLGLSKVSDFFPNVSFIAVDSGERYKSAEIRQQRLKLLRKPKLVEVEKPLPFADLVHPSQAKIDPRTSEITIGGNSTTIDGVIITTYPRDHFEIAKEWLNQGVKVYLEKPIVMPHQLTAARDFFDQHRDNLLAVDFYMDSDAFHFARDYLRSIGGIKRIEGRCVERVDTNKDKRIETLLDPEISGGGIGYDMGVHPAALIEALLQECGMSLEGAQVKKVVRGRYEGALGKAETFLDVRAKLNGIKIALDTATGYEHTYYGVTIFGEEGNSLEIMVGTERYDAYVILKAEGNEDVYTFTEASMGYVRNLSDFFLMLYGSEKRFGLSQESRLAGTLNSAQLISNAYDKAADTPMQTYELFTAPKVKNPLSGKIPDEFPQSRSLAGIEDITKDS